ncbi:kinase-like domain-containing protein [Gongronella butleri]|nr:kinase-like domain-containing protein [Gongronella butleri]
MDTGIENDVTPSSLPNYNDLHDYRLLCKLGDGAFSVVYKAQDVVSNDLVAIKIIQKTNLKPRQRISILKEVQLMQAVDHDAIVSLRRFVETAEHYFIVMELCQGGELFQQIVHLTYFSEDLARHCIRQVADGIYYLHEVKGVVHRDIKPENLLFESIPFLPRTDDTQPPTAAADADDDEPKVDEGAFIENYGGGGIGKVKIADFGLSKIVWDETTHTPCGTMGYTAPEIVLRRGYSKSVDMWALGCVLYTMLCGFPPFYDDDDIDILTDKVARGDYTFMSPWWDSISDDAKDLVAQLLCVDPLKRIDIHQFMQHPWILQQVRNKKRPESA